MKPTEIGVNDLTPKNYIPETIITSGANLSQDWYENLIDDCKTIIVETEFTSRWSLVEGYHQVGSRILQENENFERSKIYGENIVQRIAQSLGKSKRTLNYAIQFAREYPDLALLPEGKNVSWHHIVNKYLTTGEEKPTVKKADLYRMIKEIKEMLETEYLKAHQEEVNASIADSIYNARKQCEFIRYLQDQVEKITEGLEQ